MHFGCLCGVCKCLCACVRVWVCDVHVCEVYVSVCFRVGACEYVRVHVSACASLCLCVRACVSECTFVRAWAWVGVGVGGCVPF